MPAHGRPSRAHPDRVATMRFADRQEMVNPDANPYFALHRSFGPPLLTATDAQGYAHDWDRCFGRSAPLVVEIGPGEGGFLAQLALQHPLWNVLGVEIRYKRVVFCARRIVKLGATNARIARYDASCLDDLFAPGSLHGIWVNHPDPWPKTRHEKNRLISRWFLEDCARFLAPGGWVRLKSDFRGNVDRLEEVLTTDGARKPLPALPFAVTGRSADVTTGPAPWPDDIETNYQSKFRKRGLPVYAIEVVRGPDPWPAP